MKKILLIFLYLFALVALSINANALILIHGNPSILSGCDGTDTFVGDPGDTETFEYQDNDFCTTEFSILDTDGIINTYDATQYKNGGHSTSFAFTGAGNDDDYIEADFGSGDSDFSIDFWIYGPTLANNTEIRIFGLFSGSGHTGDMAFRIRVDGGSSSTIEFTAEGADSDTSALNTYPAAAWYRLEVDFNQNDTTTVEIYNSSDALQETLSVTANDITPRYPIWGCLYSDADATGIMYIDDVRYKSSGGGF